MSASGSKPLIGIHVLLAEDDPDQSDMLREILQDEGYQVETAFSGDVALQRMLSRNYDLVILDIRMPGMDGSMVLRKFREHADKRSVPVIVVSAFASAWDLQQYYAAGADASFAKPYDIEMLLKTIATLRQQRKGQCDHAR